MARNVNHPSSSQMPQLSVEGALKVEHPQAKRAPHITSPVRESESPPDTSPAGPRALGAMAEAVRRAREAATRTTARPSGLPAPPTTSERTDFSAARQRLVIDHDSPVASESSFNAGETGSGLYGDRPSGKRTRQDRRERHLLRSAEVLAVALLVAFTALLVSHSAPGNLGASPSRGTGIRGDTDSSVPKTQSRGPRSTPGPSAPSVTEPNAPAGGVAPPELSSLTPPEGSSGQTVTVSGANLFSADGQILTRFGGQTAPTSCPTQTSCMVTVPANASPSSSVPVTITTDSGTSNSLIFVYG